MPGCGADSVCASCRHLSFYQESRLWRSTCCAMCRPEADTNSGILQNAAAADGQQQATVSCSTETAALLPRLPPVDCNALDMSQMPQCRNKVWVRILQDTCSAWPRFTLAPLCEAQVWAKAVLLVTCICLSHRAGVLILVMRQHVCQPGSVFSAA